MNMRHATILASLLFALLANGTVRAEDTPAVYPAMGEMTQQEYADYRARISKQLEEKVGSNEAKETRIRKPANGYGRGYRARQERAMDNGMMGRAAGRIAD